MAVRESGRGVNSLGQEASRFLATLGMLLLAAACSSPASSTAGAGGSKQAEPCTKVSDCDDGAECSLDFCEADHGCAHVWLSASACADLTHRGAQESPTAGTGGAPSGVLPGSAGDTPGVAVSTGGTGAASGIVSTGATTGSSGSGGTKAFSAGGASSVSDGVIGGAPPAQWACSPSYFRSGDGCDCGCGAPDPDCGTAACTAPGCSALGCQYCHNGSVFSACGALGSGDPAKICAGPGGSKMRPMPAGYCIDTTETTRGQYQAWLAQTPRPAVPTACVKNSDFAPDPSCQSAVPSGADYVNHPQGCVDWCDAEAYCRSVGKRLCSAAESAVTCASTGHSFPYGNSYDANLCNGIDHAGGAPVPVGSLWGCQSPVSAYRGVYDLSGNAAEWVSDCSTSTDQCQIVGGSAQRGASDLSCSAKQSVLRMNHQADVGFRCCSGATTQPVDPVDPVDPVGNLLTTEVLETGWVGGDPATSVDNPSGFQGPIRLYGDNITCIPPAKSSGCGPYGCCLDYTTITDTTFASWGCGISFDLNATGDSTEGASDSRKRGYSGSARGLSITYTNEGTGLLRGRYVQMDPEPTSEVAPFVDAPKAGGKLDIPFKKVVCPTWTGSTCTPPSASPFTFQLEVRGGEGKTSGKLCITSIVPIL